MANNLVVSYDLNSPGQNYDAVIEQIQSLGSWAKIHYSYWYVNSPLTARQAVDHVWPVMDSNDSIFVVDATNNNAAWENLPPKVSDHIKAQWNL